MITPGGRVGDASPLGRKGGPRRLDDYVRAVAHALMRKRGFTKSHAIATAKNALKRWRRGGGHVRPQVRAGAAAHLGIQAGLDAGHSEEQLRIIDLALAEADRRAFLDFATVAGLHGDEIDFAMAHAPYRYRHGWIPLRGAMDGPRATDARYDPLHPRHVFGAIKVKPLEADAHLKTRGARKARRATERSTEASASLNAALARLRETKPTRRTAKKRSRTEVQAAKRRKRTIDAARREQSRRLAMTRKINAAQQEQARRIVASTGLHLGATPHGRTRRTATGTLYGQSLGKGVAPVSALSGLFSSFSEDQQAVLDLAVVEAAGRDIELAPHWKHGWIPLNEEALAIKLKREKAAGHLKLPMKVQPPQTPEHADAEKHATRILDDIKKHEPAITSDLKGTVESLGGAMEALQDSPDHPLDFRFKALGSLTRKIHDKARAKGVSHEDYANQVGDALRYTALFDSKNFVEDGHALLKHLEDRGYKVEGVENTFAHGQAYSGVNTNIISPDGVRWELQLHTPESISAKHFIHPHYETYRSSTSSEAERRKAYNTMLAANSRLRRPDGFEAFGQQIHRPDAERFDRTERRLAQRKLKASGLTKQFGKTTVREATGAH